MKSKQALTTGEVARFCGVNFRTVIRWIERGHLDAYKLPGRGDNRIPVESFIEFLKKNDMPVPDELTQQTLNLVWLADANDDVANVTALIRRSGWMPVVTQDAMQFGFWLAAQTPSALLVSSSEQAAAVSRLLRDDAAKSVLKIQLAMKADDSALEEGWQRLHWSEEQKQLQQLLLEQSA